jgi:hypothetical protein
LEDIWEHELACFVKKGLTSFILVLKLNKVAFVFAVERTIGALLFELFKTLIFLLLVWGIICLG